eukprot:10550591-Alexandrium_andersonii.AAC.1
MAVWKGVRAHGVRRLGANDALGRLVLALVVVRVDRDAASHKGGKAEVPIVDAEVVAPHVRRRESRCMPLRRGPGPLEDRGRVQGELCVGALRKDCRAAGEAHVRREPEE